MQGEACGDKVCTMHGWTERSGMVRLLSAVDAVVLCPDRSSLGQWHFCPNSWEDWGWTALC